MSQEAVVA